MFDFLHQNTALNSLYAYLSTKDIPGFQENVKSIKAAKGKIIYDVEQQYTDIYEIESGVVKLGGRSSKDEDYIYELVTQGEIFGNVSFLNKPFKEYCKVVIPTKLYAFNRDFFVYHVLHDHIATEIFIKQIVHRWHKTESILSAIRQFEPRERINRLFENLNIPITVDESRKVLLSKNLTYKDIADLTGTTRQLVAEILR
ncbi:Crp/Fnr family transcriptional regulator [Gynurincola endophyticus]|uniref:Crp/Fnr family transcriptional regulator n=1 Tax=Gynurincola endophyticus TaxID=2479004 RepID=UPI000F8EC912|nr:Crp/Fnr family transcriptional regulator [Gynurincola endophyticus]